MEEKDINSILRIKQLTVGESFSRYVNSSMASLSGKIAKIIYKGTDTKGLYYRIDLDDCTWCWTPDMFDCISKKDLPITLESDIFGKMIIVDITSDSDYPIDVKLEDGDIISLTTNFQWFKNKKPIKFKILTY